MKLIFVSLKSWVREIIYCLKLALINTVCKDILCQALHNCFSSFFPGVVLYSADPITISSLLDRYRKAASYGPKGEIPAPDETIYY